MEYTSSLLILVLVRHYRRDEAAAATGMQHAPRA
jgi:hypothetical protein